MALEIRPIRDDEVEQAEFITAYAFNSQNRWDLTEAVAQARRFWSLEWSLAAFQDGEMTAFLRVVPFAMRLNGRGLSFGAVGPVATLPQHRRRGHVGALLRRSLSDMRERGQVLSGLHTPHPALYRRSGWEIASNRRWYTFAPKDIVLKAAPRERGTTRLLGPDDWNELDRIYRAHSRERNGPLHRGELWWREAVFSVSRPPRADAGLWLDGQGEPQGYALYAQVSHPNPEVGATLFLRELVALTSDAYLNLVHYLLRHDIAREIRWGAPPDDPFLSLVDDATKVKVEEQYDLLLRVVDVGAALSARPPATEGAVSFTIEISDPSAPWHEGVWRVEAANGAATAERADSAPDLSLTATTLAPLLSGYLAPSAAALAGLVDVHRPEALPAADRFFAVTHPPYCSDFF